MPKLQIFFDEKEDEVIRTLAAKWNISKHDAVKKIVKELYEGGEK